MECCSICFRNCDKPRLIEALKTKRIRDIACGSSHSAALTSSGELYTWGLGEYGRLGHGDNTTQLKPKMVIIGMFIVHRKLAVGWFHEKIGFEAREVLNTSALLAFSLEKMSPPFLSACA